MTASIYLDYQSTTPLAPEALEAMLPWLRDGFANPHSSHAPGRRAAAAIEVARAEVAALLPPGGRLIFTSGATEALNIAIGGVAKADPAGIVTLASEHAAVLDTALAHDPQARRLPVGGDGLIDMAALTAALRPRPALVAAMLVNNEIGVIQPVADIAAAAHAAGALMLCDAVQGYGRIAIPPTCDLVAISAHKIFGPKGIGALWLRDDVKLAPVAFGGGQEDGLRSGTLSPALCAGFGAAARLMRDRVEADRAHLDVLWQRALDGLAGWTINGSRTARYRGNINARLPGLDVARLMSDIRHVAFSAGSACASGSGRPSHVLRAIGLADADARASIRLGFGRYTTVDDIDAGIGAIAAAARVQQEEWA